MSVCLVSAPAWSSVTGGSLSRQEWMRSFLTTLCETLAIVEGVPVPDCSVAGVWDKVTGGGYLSEQEFWAASLATMCLIKDNIGGGGGTTNPVYTGAAPPAAPTDPTQPAIFYPDNDALPIQVWNTTTLAWRDV